MMAVQSPNPAFVGVFGNLDLFRRLSNPSIFEN